MIGRCLLLLIVLLLATSGLVCAQEEGSGTPVGVDVQVFMPTNSATQDIFGDRWTGIGLQAIRPHTEDRWDRLFSFDAYGSTDVGRAQLLIANIGVVRGLTAPDDMQPYVILRAGPYYGKAEVPSMNIDDSGIGFNANAAAGILFKKRFFVEARYDYFSKLGGFNFDGLTLSAGIKLFTIK